MTLDYLTQRAIKLHTGRVPGARQPGADLNGPATAGGLDYVVLRNLGGVLAVYRVLPLSKNAEAAQALAEGGGVMGAIATSTADTLNLERIRHYEEFVVESVAILNPTLHRLPFVTGGTERHRLGMLLLKMGVKHLHILRERSALSGCNPVHPQIDDLLLCLVLGHCFFCESGVDGFGAPKRPYELGQRFGTLRGMVQFLNHHLVVALAVNEGVHAVAQLVRCIGVLHSALTQEQRVGVRVHLGLEWVFQLAQGACHTARKHGQLIDVSLRLSQSALDLTKDPRDLSHAQVSKKFNHLIRYLSLVGAQIVFFGGWHADYRSNASALRRVELLNRNQPTPVLGPPPQKK